jgi:hypothetical protein
MQRLALMMAVMMLGMPLVSGCNISVGSRGQGTGNQGEMMRSPSTWFGNSGGTLTTEKGISSATLEGSPPVEPGGFPVERILQQVQQGMEGILIMDYWMVLPIIVMVVTSLIMRIQRHLGETWRPGDDGPFLAKVGGANLPIDGGGTGSNNN